MAYEINYEIADQIKAFLKEEETSGLKIFLGTVDPVIIAGALKFLSDDDKLTVINNLPVWSASAVLGETDEGSQEDIIEEMKSEELGILLEEMDTDDAVDILDDMDEEDQERVLAAIEKIESDHAQTLRTLLKYPEDTAGGIMVPEVLAINSTQTIGDAVDYYKQVYYDEGLEDIVYMFVTDKDGKLQGYLPLKSLLLYSDDTPISEAMNQDVHYVNAIVDQEVVANLVRKFDLLAVPVVDDDMVLLGRITADDILDVIHEEAVEDLSHMAGMSDDEFDEESILSSVGNRIPWLLIGLAGGTISATVVSHFEGALNMILALAFFVPVVTAMGGNAGVQSSAIIVRGIAMGDIHPRYILSRLYREFQIAFINGMICALALGAIVYFWRQSLFLASIIALSLQLILVIATLVGTSVPLILRALKIDPAIAMGPFVTTLNDILGLLIYLSLATLAISLAW